MLGIYGEGGGVKNGDGWCGGGAGRALDYGGSALLFYFKVSALLLYFLGLDLLLYFKVSALLLYFGGFVHRLVVNSLHQLCNRYF